MIALSASLLALAGSGVAQATNGVEARCLELGANCVCSEPMDSADVLFNRPPEAHNFTDSPAATDCSRFGTYFESDNDASAFSTPTATGVLATPGGGVNRVLRIEAGHGGIVWLQPRQSATATDRRMCMRYYKRVSNDYSGAGYPGQGCASERNKVFQMTFGASRIIQIEERSDFGSGCYGPGNYKDFWLVNHNAGQSAPFTIDWDNCNERTGWCRFELCASGDLARGQNIKIEGRITALGIGKDEIRTVTTGWNPGVGLGGSIIGGDVFHGQGSGPLGHESLSHFMQATWPTDAGQWIGASTEFEGGAGGGTGGATGGTGGASTPISAPVLLP